MKTYNCDIWKLLDRADAICITTNGMVSANGEAVMGAGIALQAAQRFPGIKTRLARHLAVNGNVPGMINIDPCIISFPTKNDWRDPSDLALIEQSAKALSAMIHTLGWTKVACPKPGCANGKLSWAQVEPILQAHIPELFICNLKGAKS